MYGCKAVSLTLTRDRSNNLLKGRAAGAALHPSVTEPPCRQLRSGPFQNNQPLWGHYCLGLHPPQTDNRSDQIRIFPPQSASAGTMCRYA